MQPPVSCDSKSIGLDEGPEEGEIVSDDLEDISDDSIIFTPCNGKSLSRRDHLHALSLSSVTDIEETPLESRKRRKSCNRKHMRHRKKSKKKSFKSDSSDDGNGINSTLKRQLKAAVQVEVEEAHKNSLRARLQPMIKNSNGFESDTNSLEQKPDNQDLESSILCPENETLLEVSEITSDTPVVEEQKDDDHDTELRELRIEALKTAIANKFGKGKRKKDLKIPCDDTNKENTSNNSEETQKTSSTNESKLDVFPISTTPTNEPQNSIPPSPDEDEDVLRALLLASISKKITEIEPTEARPNVQIKPNITNKVTLHNAVPNKITSFKSNISKVKIKTTKVSNLTKMPPVKPLIININSESDSDLDINSSIEQSQKECQEESANNVGASKKKVEQKNIRSSVEKFLKEQRAKVELETNVSKSLAMKPSTATGLISNVKNVQKNTLILNLPKIKKPITTIDKSTLKLLPKNKQEEYKNLLLKLKKAELRKPHVRRIAQKNSDSNKTVVINNLTLSNKNGVVSKNISSVSNKMPVVVKNSTSTPVFAKLKQNKVKYIASKLTSFVSAQKIEYKHQERKSDALLLHSVLKEVQIRHNGRLQIQENYKLLRPLVKKINDVSKEQKSWNQEVNKLLEQLSEARRKQQEVQKYMTACVKELVDTKKKIDRSLIQRGVEVKSSKLLTSTPLKQNTPIESFPNYLQNMSQISSISASSSKSANVSKNKNQKTATTVSKPKIAPKLPSNIKNTLVNMKSNSAEVIEKSADLNIKDPNDVDCIIERTLEKVAVLERNNNFECKKSQKVRYVSPLNQVRRQHILNPLIEMCPYEVDGTCKDAQCAYNHLPKEIC